MNRRLLASFLLAIGFQTYAMDENGMDRGEFTNLLTKSLAFFGLESCCFMQNQYLLALQQMSAQSSPSPMNEMSSTESHDEIESDMSERLPQAIAQPSTSALYNIFSPYQPAPSRLYIHRKFKTTTNTYKCSFGCENTYSSAKAVARHERVRHREPGYMCQVCKTTFFLKTNFEQHICTRTKKRVQ